MCHQEMELILIRCRFSRLPALFVWGMQVFFDQNGQGSIDGNGQSAATFTYAYNAWLHPEVIVNLNTDWAEFYLDGTLVHGWQWS